MGHDLLFMVVPFSVSNDGFVDVVSFSDGSGFRSRFAMSGLSSPSGPKIIKEFSKVDSINTPLEHTPKPLPTGYEGIVFILG